MSGSASNLQIDADRLWDALEDMAKIGPGIAGGNNRQTLTDEDREGRVQGGDRAGGGRGGGGGREGGRRPGGGRADGAYVPGAGDRSRGSTLVLKLRRFCDGVRFKCVFY